MLLPQDILNFPWATGIYKEQPKKPQKFTVRKWNFLILTATEFISSDKQLSRSLVEMAQEKLWMSYEGIVTEEASVGAASQYKSSFYPVCLHRHPLQLPYYFSSKCLGQGWLGTHRTLLCFLCLIVLDSVIIMQIIVVPGRDCTECSLLICKSDKW